MTNNAALLDHLVAKTKCFLADLYSQVQSATRMVKNKDFADDIVNDVGQHSGGATNATYSGPADRNERARLEENALLGLDGDGDGGIDDLPEIG
jgi:hypothetical protein